MWCTYFEFELKIFSLSLDYASLNRMKPLLNTKNIIVMIQMTRISLLVRSIKTKLQGLDNETGFITRLFQGG